jgi:hypothetical protein
VSSAFLYEQRQREFWRALWVGELGLRIVE